jgi:Flp pilus assembly pilin Flp
MKGGGSHHTIARRVRAEHGQAMAEYAVILSLIFLAVVVAYQLLGESVVGLYDRFVATF